jgi:hypothetical protein
MSRRFNFGLLASAAGLYLPIFALAATQPSAGYYATSGYVASATPSSVCSLAGQTAGASYSGVFYYPGPSKTGTTFRQITNTSKAESVTLETFPKTPAAGVTNYAGTITEGTEGSGSTVSLPFKATITFLDANSFEAQLVTPIALSATATCTVTDDLVLVKTGS